MGRFTMLGADEIVLVVALVLITAGLWLLVGQGALLASAAVFLWIGLPSRLPFIVRSGVVRKVKPRREKNVE